MGSDAEVLKDSPLRSVHREYSADGSSSVLKRYRRRGLVDAVRSLWRRSRARVEARNLERARALGLPCPEPRSLRIEERLMPRWAELELEDLGRGRDVASLVAAGEADAALLGRVGELIARACHAGLVHRDLHLGNVFLRANGELALLDLHAARFVARPRRITAAQLGALYLSLPWPDQAGLRRALFAPLGVRPDVPPRLLRAHLAHRIERCTRDSGDFVRRIDPHGQRWLARRELDVDTGQIHARLASATLIKSGRRGSVWRCAGESPGWIIKVRMEAAALRLWLAAEALALRRIPHAQALAWLRLDAPSGTASAGDRARVRMEAPQPAACVLSLERHGTELEALDERQRRGAARDLGRSLARLHATGWRCRDTRADNFLIDEGRAVFVDLDGVRPRRGPLGATVAADLGRLLAWWRHQAPEAWRHDLRLGLALWTSWCREFVALSGRQVQRSLPQRIELRCERWRRKHRNANRP